MLASGVDTLRLVSPSSRRGLVIRKSSSVMCVKPFVVKLAKREGSSLPPAYRCAEEFLTVLSAAQDPSCDAWKANSNGRCEGQREEGHRV